MGWQYRVCKETTTYNGCVDENYTLREVHSDKPAAKITDDISYSTEPCKPYGINPQELKEDLEMMALAFDLPVLDLDKINNAKETNS